MLRNFLDHRPVSCQWRQWSDDLCWWHSHSCSSEKLLVWRPPKHHRTTWHPPDDLLVTSWWPDDLLVIYWWLDNHLLTSWWPHDLLVTYWWPHDLLVTSCSFFLCSSYSSSLYTQSFVSSSSFTYFSSLFSPLSSTLPLTPLLLFLLPHPDSILHPELINLFTLIDYVCSSFIGCSMTNIVFLFFFVINSLINVWEFLTSDWLVCHLTLTRRFLSTDTESILLSQHEGYSSTKR